MPTCATLKQCMNYSNLILNNIDDVKYHFPSESFMSGNVTVEPEDSSSKTLWNSVLMKSLTNYLKEISLSYDDFSCLSAFTY